MSVETVNSGGFAGDPAEALNPPASENTCCGTAAEAAAEGSCCGSAAKADAVASGAQCCG